MVLCGGLVHYPFYSPQKSLKKEHFLLQLSMTKELEAEMKSREDVIKDLEKFEHEAGKKKKEERRIQIFQRDYTLGKEDC